MPRRQDLCLTSIGFPNSIFFVAGKDNRNSFHKNFPQLINVGIHVKDGLRNQEMNLCIASCEEIVYNIYQKGTYNT